MPTRKAVRYSVNSKRQITGTELGWLAERFWWTKSQSSLLNIYFRLSGFQSSLLLIHFRYSLNTCWHCTKVCHRTYPICDGPLPRSLRRSFAPLQKSRHNHDSYVWTEALSGMAFILAQERSTVVFRNYPRTARNVKKSCDQGLAVRFTFVRLDHTSEVSDLPQRFLHPKRSQYKVWEEILLFTTPLLIDYRILFPKNVILNTISQLK